MCNVNELNSLLIVIKIIIEASAADTTFNRKQMLINHNLFIEQRILEKLFFFTTIYIYIYSELKVNILLIIIIIGFVVGRFRRRTAHTLCTVKKKNK